MEGVMILTKSSIASSVALIASALDVVETLHRKQCGIKGSGAVRVLGLGFRFPCFERSSVS